MAATDAPSRPGGDRPATHEAAGRGAPTGAAASDPAGAAGGAAGDVASPPTPSTPAGAIGRGSRLRAAWALVAFPVTRFLGIGVVLYLTVWLSTRFLERNPSYPIQALIVFRGDQFLEGWVRWDAGYYVQISATGYTWTPGRMSSVAFFPAYPLAMRLVSPLLGDPDHVLPGIVVTALCGLAAAVLLWRWFLRRVPVPRAARADARVVEAGAADAGTAAPPVAAARLALLLALLFPYAWYLYGAVYADALFLAFTVAAFLLVERDRPVLAGLVAAVATAARPVGAGVFLGLVAVRFEQRGIVTVPLLDRVRAVGWRAAGRELRARRADGSWWREGFRPEIDLERLAGRDLGVLLSLGGLLAWMAYLRGRFGDWVLFVHAEAAPGWDQQPGPRTWLKFTWLKLLGQLPETLTHLGQRADWDRFVYTAGITAQALLVLGALCLVPVVVRRIGWGYAVYILGVVGIPLLGSKDWQGTGRYLLAAFPVVAVVATGLLERPTAVRRGVLVVSAALLVLLTSAFARGYYLA